MMILGTEETAAEVAGAVEQVTDIYSSQLERFIGSLPSNAAVFGIKVLTALILFFF